MSDTLQPPEAAAARKAIRDVFMLLESALNSADYRLQRRLFARSAVIVTAQDGILTFARAIPIPLSLFGGKDDSPAYCLLAIDDVLLLSARLAYARITLNLRLIAGDRVVDQVAPFSVILRRQRADARWRFCLFHFVTRHPAGV